ncbi:MAG: glycosyltransferase [Verrucomicrobiota bacterium]|nr:glycosyltransferase [Verrucomicrobiota bacterium]
MTECRRLRLVHVFGSALAGEWATCLLTGLRERGHQVTVVCPSDGDLPERVKPAGIESKVLDFPVRMRRLDQGLRYISALAEFLRSRQADVVHNHLVPANIWGRIAGKMARAPVRVTQWPGPRPLEVPRFRRLEMTLAGMDNGIIASCRATQRFYEAHSRLRARTRLIYYGFSSDRFDPSIRGTGVRESLGLGPEDIVVSLIAHFYPPVHGQLGGLGLKGHEIFIQAAAEARKTSPGIKFLIVGDALVPGGAESYKAALCRMVDDLGLRGTVIFAGRRTDIVEILGAADIAAVPSLSENVGGVVEPLLMEKPVIASNVGGLPDVVLDGQTGFLVPSRDPEALAAAILRMAAVPAAERREMGRRGRAIVMDLFDPRRTVGQTEMLYYDLLGRADAHRK